MIIRGFWLEAGRRIGAGVIGLAFLWQVAERAGRSDGEAVIHVTEPNVDVRIDGYTYPIEPDFGTPIVCPLRPGSHTFAVLRDGRTLHEETFQLESGGQTILTARDGTRPTRAPRRRSPSDRW